MADYKQSDLTISTYERLFNGEGKNGDGIVTDVHELPICLIDDFPNNPYKVRDDEDMEVLVDSIRTRGLITPAIVRKKDGGRYEIVSGHRRKFACIKLGLATMKCTVVEINQDEAAMMLVESNFQRTEILPTEKGYAYRLRLEAMRRIGGRPRLEKGDTMCHPFSGEKSVDILVKETGESRGNIRKYIRLTYLISKLQEFVNERKIAVMAGATLSFISEKNQYEVIENIERTKRFPSIVDAKRLRKEYEALEKAEKETVQPSDLTEPETVLEDEPADNAVAGSEPIRKDEPATVNESRFGRTQNQEHDFVSARSPRHEHEEEKTVYPKEEPVRDSKAERTADKEELLENIPDRELVIPSETVRLYINDFGSIENMAEFIRRKLDDNHECLKRRRGKNNGGEQAETAVSPD